MEVGRTATVGRMCPQGMIPAMTILLLILLVLAVARFVLLRPIRTRPVDAGLAHTSAAATSTRRRTAGSLRETRSTLLPPTPVTHRAEPAGG